MGGGAMRTACGVLTPCCSQIGKVLSSRSRITRGFTGLSSGASECFGVRTCLRSVDLNAVRRAPCDSQRTAVIASIERSDVCRLRFSVWQPVWVDCEC